MKKATISFVLVLAMCVAMFIPAAALYTTDELDNRADVSAEPIGDGWALFAEVYGRERAGHVGINEQTTFYLLRTYFWDEYNINYNYNLGLEEDGIGYIENQRTCPNFKIGYHNMSDVGCEIAAVYNSLKLIGEETLCSNIIREFESESYLMSFLGSAGNMGSDPFAIAEYFDDHSISYDQYDDFDTMKDDIDDTKNENQVYIVSYWNSSQIEDGVHTIALYTTSSSNDIYLLNKASGTTADSLSDVTNDSNFIVGYAVG